MWRTLALSVLAIIIGGCAGPFLFSTVESFFPDLLPTWNYHHAQYGGGIVTLHDMQGKRLHISVGSSYAESEPRTEIEFVYDERTLWPAQTYIFQDGLRVRQRLEVGKAFQLPTGARVTVVLDPYTTKPLRAQALLVVKRNDL